MVSGLIGGKDGDNVLAYCPEGMLATSAAVCHRPIYVSAVYI